MNLCILVADGEYIIQLAKIVQQQCLLLSLLNPSTRLIHASFSVLVELLSCFMYPLESILARLLAVFRVSPFWANLA